MGVCLWLWLVFLELSRNECRKRIAMQIILTYRHVPKFCLVKFQLNRWNKRTHFPNGFFIVVSGALMRMDGKLGSAGATDQRTYMWSLVWLGILQAWQLSLRRKHLETKYSKGPKQKLQGLFWPSLGIHASSLPPHFMGHKTVTSQSRLKWRGIRPHLLMGGMADNYSHF